jgi:uroporphyrinogen-III synthase
MSKIYLCSPKRYEGVEYLPMIDFRLIATNLDLSWCDTILFSSKQAVIYADMLNREWRDKKIVAVGPATKDMASKLGAKDIYYPKEYYGEVLANDILKFFKDRKILYIRPKVVSFDSYSYLKRYNIEVKESIIYETVCKNYKDKELEEGSIIIFTSPSTIKCFLKNFKWDRSFKAVVIGKKTLQNLPSYIKAEVADTQTISSCIQKAKTL